MIIWSDKHPDRGWEIRTALEAHASREDASEYVGFLVGAIFYYRRIVQLEDQKIPNREKIEEAINQHCPMGDALLDAVTWDGSGNVDRIRSLLGDLDPSAFFARFIEAVKRLAAIHSLEAAKEQHA